MASSARFFVQANKAQVLIELGSRFTKFGFAGEPAPLAIVPSVGRLSGGKSVALLNSGLDYQTRVDALTNFIRNVYTRVLLTNAKERKVVILLDPFVHQDVERAVFSVFLRILEVPSLTFLAPHMTVFPALGTLNTGLVIDVGNTTKIIPVALNTGIVGSWEVLPQAGYAALLRYVTDNLAGSCTIVRSTSLSDTDEPEVFSDSEKASIFEQFDMDQFCQELADRWLACTTRQRGEKLMNGLEYGKDFPPFPNVKRNIRIKHRSHEVVISGRFVEEAMEMFFRPNLDGETLPSAVLNVILRSPIDLRKQMTQFILVIGGLADVRNFIPRLNDELYELAKEPRYAERMPGAEFRFVATDTVPPNIIAWRGGSLLASVNYFSEDASFTRDDLMLRASGNNVSHLLKEWSYVGKDKKQAR